MSLSVHAGPGVRLAVVLVLLTVLFAGVVYLTIVDKRTMEASVEADLRRQTAQNQLQVSLWSESVKREYARQMAAPFLYNIETLAGVDEGTAEFRLIQKRMWQFVYGSDQEPLIARRPIGPLESVVIVDLEHRIVAASSNAAVDMRFTNPEDIRILDAALKAPQIVPVVSGREDGRPVQEISVGVPNSRGEPIGVVRMRHVGGQLTQVPMLQQGARRFRPQLWGPLLAGLLAVLGVGFGAVATYEVVQLTRRMEAMAKGQPLPREAKSGVGARALSLIEERLEVLSGAVKRDDLLVSALSEALREGVVLLDPHGKPVVTNRQARQILGVDGPAVPSVSAAFPALLAANPALDDVVRAGLRDRQAVRERTLSLTLPDGTQTAAQVTAYVLAEGRTVTGMMLVLKDRLSIEVLERNLREASRLQTIVRLTGSVAHEVKNPLGAIGIHLEQLRRRLSRLKEADPAAEERVNIIRDEIGRVRDVLEEWLGLTSPEERVPSNASLDEVLGSVARLLRVEARHQRVDLIVEQEGEAGPVALGAPRLRQVLLNLCLNALQAMPDGGRLTLRARTLGGQALIDVEDTGSGIPDALRDRVFEVHFTTRPDGSGLGLAICKRLIEESGGSIEFDSRPGAGTTFRIALPLAPAARERRPAVAAGVTRDEA
jgi:signal transduction histidine kinase